MKRLKAKEDETRLEKYVRGWLNRSADDYNGSGWQGALKDLLYGGCQSGMVGELIYYRDTVKFYKRFQSEIDALLKESMSSIGCDGPSGLFGDKWDKDDPLAREDLNQNLLAWFGFEETARNIGLANGYDD